MHLGLLIQVTIGKESTHSFSIGIDDGESPPVWFYNIRWNETKYNADNDTGWEAIKSNDAAETPTKYNWNGSAWTSE